MKNSAGQLIVLALASLCAAPSFSAEIWDASEFRVHHDKENEVTEPFDRDIPDGQAKRLKTTARMGDGVSFITSITTETDPNDGFITAILDQGADQMKLLTFAGADAGAGEKDYPFTVSGTYTVPGGSGGGGSGGGGEESEESYDVTLEPTVVATDLKSLTVTEIDNEDNNVKAEESPEATLYILADQNASIKLTPELDGEGSGAGDDILWVVKRGDAGGTTVDSGDFSGSATPTVALAVQDDERLFTVFAGRDQDDDDSLDVSGSASDEVQFTVAVHLIQVNGITLKGKSESGAITDGEDRFLFANSVGLVEFFADTEPVTSSQVPLKSDMLDHFRWTISEVTGIPDGKKTPIADHGDGVTAKGPGSSSATTRFRFTQLPTDNTGFGPKTLTLVVRNPADKQDADIEKTAEPRLFFARLDKSHPAVEGVGDTANWYFYWSLEGAGDGTAVSQFSRDGEHADFAQYWEGAHHGKFEPDEGPDGTIYIGNKAAASDPEKWPGDAEVNEFPEGQNPPNDTIQFTIDARHAPDFVNVTYAHEATHRVLQKDVPQLGLDDDDGDRIPNDWEAVVPGMKYEVEAELDEQGEVSDPEDTDSFEDHFKVSAASDATRDEEFYCVLGGARSDLGDITGNPLTGPYNGVVPDQANIEYDWSVDSENWKSNGD